MVVYTPPAVLGVPTCSKWQTGCTFRAGLELGIIV